MNSATYVYLAIYLPCNKTKNLRAIAFRTLIKKAGLSMPVNFLSGEATKLTLNPATVVSQPGLFASRVGDMIEQEA